ncbi:MAG: glycyl-radical enzyme activating protein [archaeon]|nr:glycyl-radical enzyme activating protein [archaeon]
MAESNSSEIKGYIFEIQKMSTEDGPGIRTTIFFKMCNLRCVWCHNPESIHKEPSIQWFGTRCIGCKTCLDVCPKDSLILDKKGIHIDREKCNLCGICVKECPGTALQIFGKKISVNDLFHEIAKDKAYYKSSNGGITVSGGEAALQAEFLIEFLKKCKENSIHTALDTGGLVLQKNYEKLAPYIDLVLFDIKEIDSNKHKNFTGVSNEKILDNSIWWIQKLEETNGKMWIRTPIIPEHTATEENITGIGSFIVEKLKNKVERWDLLAYNNLAKSKYRRMDISYNCEKLELLTKDEMEEFLKIAIKTGVKNVKWSGMTKK